MCKELSGVGKSHAAQALGHIACRKGYEVTYERTSVLLDWIHAGRGDGTYQRHRHEATARYAYDLPCGWCGTPLSYSAAHQRWRCSGCGVVYDDDSLAELAREHGC